MRRLGAELGVDPMAAYRHLPTRRPCSPVWSRRSSPARTSRPTPRRRGRSSSRRSRAPIAGRCSPTAPRSPASRPRRRYNSLESLRIVEHGTAILTAAGVPRRGGERHRGRGPAPSGAVLLEAFWREHAATGGEIHLSPPLLPHPGFPVLSEAATAEDFLTPEAVFEFGLVAIVHGSAALVPRPAPVLLQPVVRGPAVGDVQLGRIRVVGDLVGHSPLASEYQAPSGPPEGVNLSQRSKRKSSIELWPWYAA